MRDSRKSAASRGPRGMPPPELQNTRCSALSVWPSRIISLTSNLRCQPDTYHRSRLSSRFVSRMNEQPSVGPSVIGARSEASLNASFDAAAGNFFLFPPS